MHNDTVSINLHPHSHLFFFFFKYEDKKYKDITSACLAPLVTNFRILLPHYGGVDSGWGTGVEACYRRF